MTIESGFRNEIPRIESVRFTIDSIILDLVDGRRLTVPINRYPDIQKLTPVQRRKYSKLAGMGLMFDDIDTVYHISDFLGGSENMNDSYSNEKSKNVHSLVAEPKVIYTKGK